MPLPSKAKDDSSEFSMQHLSKANDYSSEFSMQQLAKAEDEISEFSMQHLKVKDESSENPKTYFPPDDFVLPFSDTPQRFKSNKSKTNESDNSKSYSNNGGCVPKTQDIGELKFPRLSTFSTNFLASVNEGTSYIKPKTFNPPADLKPPFNDAPDHYSKLEKINENGDGQYKSHQKENRSPTYFQNNFAKPRTGGKSKSSVKKKIAYDISDHKNKTAKKKIAYSDSVSKPGDNCLEEMTLDTSKVGAVMSYFDFPKI